VTKIKLLKWSSQRRIYFKRKQAMDSQIASSFPEEKFAAALKWLV
jgi:hypothetical protein